MTGLTELCVPFVVVRTTSRKQRKKSSLNVFFFYKIRVVFSLLFLQLVPARLQPVISRRQSHHKLVETRQTYIPSLTPKGKRGSQHTNRVWRP